MANERELAEFIYTRLLEQPNSSQGIEDDIKVEVIENAIKEFNSRDEQTDENVEPEEE